MFRALLRVVLVLVVLVGIGMFVLGWWGRGRSVRADEPHPTATSGRIDAGRAREAGAEVGERAAKAANAAEETLAEGTLTAKIKSKMALDDTVKARDIRVSTDNGVVTLSGTVESPQEHDRAVQLARETAGVTRVVDHLAVQR